MNINPLGELSTVFANAKHVAIFRDYFTAFVMTNTFYLKRFYSNSPNGLK